MSCYKRIQIPGQRFQCSKGHIGAYPLEYGKDNAYAHWSNQIGWYCIKCWKEKQKQKQRLPADNRLKKYGITERDYKKLRTKHSGLCPICGDPAKCIDHNHLTKEVRGLLCKRCNSMLGFARENVVILFNGIKYLKKQL